MSAIASVRSTSRSGRARLAELAVKLLRRPEGLFGSLVAVGLLVVVVLGPLLAAYGAATQDIPHRLEGPSASHLLGTDQLGRDLLSRLIVGTRVELGVAVPAVAMALVIGLALGLLAGYRGGMADNVVVVLTDSLQAFPAVILALTLLAVVGPSLSTVLIVIGVAYAPGFARVARALVLGLKESSFVDAERALGAGPVRIVVNHILPNLTAPMIVLVAMNLPSAIAVEAGLSFLGLGVQPPTPSWGVILADGFANVRSAPWAVASASLALVITTLGLTALGESLRAITDPTQSRSA
jgi:peptide/nickel transport system permease protein